MPRSAAPLPSELGEAFACARALGGGVTPRRLRAKDLEAPFRGARLRRSGRGAEEADADDAPLARDRAARARLLRLLRAYAEVMEPHAFFAGRTAAVLYGAPVERGDEDDLDVAVAAPSRAPRRRGIRGVKVAPHLVGVRTHEGLPVTSPASTWAMLGRELSVRELVRVGDFFVRTPRDASGRSVPHLRLATPEQLLRAAEAGVRRPGAGRLREALALVRVGSASLLETDLRLDAAAVGLPAAELDVEILDWHGRLLGISEFVYREFRTIIEVEGDHHRTSRAQWNRDIEKYAAYTAEGWEVVRLTSAHIRGESPRAAEAVSSVLRRRGWQPR